MEIQKFIIYIKLYFLNVLPVNVSNQISFLNHQMVFRSCHIMSYRCHIEDGVQTQ